ncbi:MAG: hypothetical protein ACYDBW_01725 [Sulfuricaulis sp.]
MDFGKLIDSATIFFHSYPYIGAALVVAAIVLIYLKPKAMFKLMAAVAIIVAMIYVGAFLIGLTKTGIDEQEKFLDSPQIKVLPPMAPDRAN